MKFWLASVVLFCLSVQRVGGSCVAQLSNVTVDCVCSNSDGVVVGQQTTQYCGTLGKNVQRVQIYCSRDTQLDITTFYAELLRSYPNLVELQIRCVPLTNFAIISDNGSPNFTRLRELDVAENELTTFRVDANLFTRVTRLNLRSNRLRADQISLGAFRNLSELDVSNNPISVIDDRTFKLLPNLTRLALANSSLEEALPLAFYVNRRILDLDLSENPRVHRVSRELFLPMRALRTLNLTGSSALFADCVPPHDHVVLNVAPSLPVTEFCSCDRAWFLQSAANTTDTLPSVLTSVPDAIVNKSALTNCLASLACSNLTVRMRTRVEKVPETTETVYLKYGDELRIDCDASSASIGYFRTPRFDQFWFVVYATMNNRSDDFRSSQELVFVRNVSEPKRSEEDAARTRVFPNGTLQIVRLGRRDAGVYVCIAVNWARTNETKSVRVLLDYTALQEVKLESVIMGLLAATCCIVVASCVRIVLFIVSQCKKVRTLKRIRELVQWSETHLAFNTHWNVPPLNLSGLVPHFVSSQFRRAPTAMVAADAVVDPDVVAHLNLDDDGVILGEVRPIGAASRADVLNNGLSADVIVEDLNEDDEVITRVDDPLGRLGVAVGPRRVILNMAGGRGPLPQTALPALPLPLPPEERAKMQRLRESVQIAMQRLSAQYGLQTDRFGRLRDYSSERMERMRENYTEKMARFRTYRDAQVEKLRQNYRYQHQYLAKLWQALSLTQCVGEEAELEFDLPEAASTAYFPVSVAVPSPHAPMSGSHRELEAAARTYYQLPPDRRPIDGLRGVMRVRPLVHNPSTGELEVQMHAYTHSESCSYPRRGTATFQQARTCRCQQPAGVASRPIRLSLLSTNFNLPYVDELEEQAPLAGSAVSDDQPTSSTRETCEEISSAQTVESPVYLDSITPSDAGAEQVELKEAPVSLSV